MLLSSHFQLLLCLWPWHPPSSGWRTCGNSVLGLGPKVDSVPLAWKHPGGHVLSPQLPHLPCPLSLEGWDTHAQKGFGEPALLGGL